MIYSQISQWARRSYICICILYIMKCRKYYVRIYKCLRYKGTWLLYHYPILAKYVFVSAQTVSFMFVLMLALFRKSRVHDCFTKLKYVQYYIRLWVDV